MKIESLQNNKVKEWMKLKEKKYRDLTGTFLIEGDHLMKEAMLKNLVLEIIARDSSFQVPDIPFYEVNDAILKKLSSQVSGTNVICVCKKLEESEIRGNVCLLDGIQDPGNLGAIIRSALAFHVDTIIMSLDTVDLYNEKVLRASEGMLFHLNFLKMNLKDAIDQLKERDYVIYGTDVKEGEIVKTVAFSERSVIIIGNEGRGMNPDLKNECHKLLHIPINKSCESLNASIAASILFYEMSKVI